MEPPAVEHSDSLALDGGKKRRQMKTRKHRDSETPIVIGKIYANWCGACNALKPEWEKMRKILSLKRRPLEWVEIEESEVKEKLSELKKKYGVDVSYTGYPTIFTIKDGQVKYYNGDRSAHKMADWYMNGGPESTNDVFGFYGGKPYKGRFSRHRRNRQNHHRNTEKRKSQKSVGFLGFFFGKA